MTMWRTLIMRGPAAASWTDAGLPALDSDETSWNGYTVRAYIPWATLVAASASKLRITVQGGTTDTITCPNVYVQKTGTVDADECDFTTTPVEVLFSGASGFTSVSGATQVSDEVTLALTGSDNIAISMYFQTGDTSRRNTSATGTYSYYKIANDASTVNTSAYSRNADWLQMIAKLEYR